MFAEAPARTASTGSEGDVCIVARGVDAPAGGISAIPSASAMINVVGVIHLSVVRRMGSQ